ncbi:ATP-binding protein [Silanimonas algicola]
MPDTPPGRFWLPSQPSNPELVAFLEMIEEAVLLVDARQAVHYANPAAGELAHRVATDPDDPDNPAPLVALLPDEVFATAPEEAWSGDVRDEARGVVLALRRYPWVVDGTPAHLLLLRDVTEARHRQDELRRRHGELQQAYARLASAQEQLLQQEKMASIGQLAAGIAHEINNPIGYVHSNLVSLRDYTSGLLELIHAYERALAPRLDEGTLAAISEVRTRVDFDFVSTDLPELINESREGLERVRRIVQDLKDFSHAGREAGWRRVDLHKGLESTLNIVWNDLKYKARVERQLGPLPLVECHPSEINQVFMNLLLNAGHAIGERGTITLASGHDEARGEAWISIRDSGPGIDPETLPRIFDPFFTTKPVGTGTGLGLSISYGIVKKHGGRIEVANGAEGGAVFTVVLPVHQPVRPGD